MKQYDYLVVGAGLFGAVFARQAADAGKKVLVIDTRDRTLQEMFIRRTGGGNPCTSVMEPIFFIRIIKTVWDYITRFAEFNRFTNSPVANYKGELYSPAF